MKRFTPLLFWWSLVPLTAAPTPLLVDSAHSRIEIIVPCTVDSFIGTLDTYVATLTVDGTRVATASLSFNFIDVHTGKVGRDTEMHKWQDTAQYPSGVFVLHALEPIVGNSGKFNASGELTLHGVTRALTFPVSVTHDQTLYAIDGEAALDTRTFGLPVIRKFALLKVSPLIKVRFHLQAVLTGTESIPTANVPHTVSVP